MYGMNVIMNYEKDKINKNNGSYYQTFKLGDGVYVGR